MSLLDKTSTNTILVSISIILLVIALLQKNNNFLDVRSIISTHFKVFTGSPLQCAAIFGVPFLLTIAALNTQVLSENIINTLNIVLSILISMFFAMLSILSSLSYRTVDKEQQNDRTAINKAAKYNRLLKETFNAVMFECILCILVLATLFTLLFINNFSNSWQLAITSAVVYYLSLLIVFNIFVLIKRIKTLFDNRAN